MGLILWSVGGGLLILGVVAVIASMGSQDDVRMSPWCQGTNPVHNFCATEGCVCECHEVQVPVI